MQAHTSDDRPATPSDNRTTSDRTADGEVSESCRKVAPCLQWHGLRFHRARRCHEAHEIWPFNGTLEPICRISAFRTTAVGAGVSEVPRISGVQSGESVVVLVTSLWLWGRRQPLPPRAKKALHCLLAAAWLQATLGVSTLLTYVPVSLASSHQAGAVTLLSVALWLTHELKLLRRIPK